MYALMIDADDPGCPETHCSRMWLAGFRGESATIRELASRPGAVKVKAVPEMMCPPSVCANLSSAATWIASCARRGRKQGGLIVCAAVAAVEGDELTGAEASVGRLQSRHGQLR